MEYELTKIGNDTEMMRKYILSFHDKGYDVEIPFIEQVPQVSEEADDKAPEDQQEKTFTGKAFDRILHQEDQATRIEEPTTKIDDENVRELDIGVNPDTQDSYKEVCSLKFTFYTMMTNLKHGTRNT